MAILLCVLLAGSVLYALKRKGKQQSSKAWLAWGLLALPAGYFMLRAGISWPLLGLAAAALLRQAFSSPAPRSAPGGAAGSNGQAARPKRMTREEALSVLGLNEGASPSEIAREYKRLMKRLHPDVGGSRYLAAKLNEAREVLS